MTNGKIATLASQATKTIRRIIEQDNKRGPSDWMVPAYAHAQHVLDMAYSMADARKCDKLSDHVYILRGVVSDLREDSHTFGYHED